MLKARKKDDYSTQICGNLWEYREFTKENIFFKVQ